LTAKTVMQTYYLAEQQLAEEAGEDWTMSAEPANLATYQALVVQELFLCLVICF